MEIQVWVGDLAEYNAGRLVGEWVTLPMDMDDILESVLEEGNEEYFIGDIDSEINLNGLSLAQMIELAERLESLDEHELKAFEAVWDSGYTSDIDEALQVVENGDFMIYHECSNMSDVAYQWYEETGQLAELEKNINSFYIDWDTIGRDMEIEGTFWNVGNDYIQIL